ncbi:DUF1904 family protein [Paenibacillus cremeus]|uniref:DUF1904 family protein n=1 Tax=Paenibacillus cremeus TaxID=2163881 RepID=A0A559KAF6_9BACL|nr:DUF1904 family protein [Paenibacillus cremeus]TVY09102.1 DUF1904 family protein [Paenibacillus cremeus]
MPHLSVRGIEAEDLRTISQPLVEELAAICACGEDQFTIGCFATISVFGGAFVSTYPFIEVAWFDRGQETRDKFAQAITKHVLSLGIPEVEIAFKAYLPECYYANGEHF